MALQDPEAEPFIGPIPDDSRLASYHVVLPSGGWVSGGDAAIPLLLMMRSTAWLGRLLRALRVTPVLRVLYRLISSNRGRLSGVVPDKPGPHRWP